MGKEPWKIRQRVKLRPGFYTPSQTNPCESSIYECKGTVVKVEDDAASIRKGACRVKWDSGYTAAYLIKAERYPPLYICDFPIKSKSFKTKLTNLNENNPNIAFKKQKEQQQIQNARMSYEPASR